jgi:hypothetical protein
MPIIQPFVGTRKIDVVRKEFAGCHEDFSDRYL